jgi:TonB family protein
MKKIYCFFILLAALTAKAQDAAETPVKKDSTAKTSSFTRVMDLKPQYPGGLKAFHEYLIKKLEPAGFVTGVHGSMIVTFVVERDGTVTDVKIKQGIEKELNLAVIKAVKDSPKWSPALQNGKPIRAQYTLPLRF